MQEGFLALYAGFTPSMCGIVVYNGIGFYAYERLKFSLAGCLKGDDGGGDRPAARWFVTFACGAFACLPAQFASYPLEIVRRRVQTAAQMGLSSNRSTVSYTFYSNILH